LSARREFGPLSEEIKDATNKALGIDSFSDTLLKMQERIKSVMLIRVLKLEASALKTGGNFSGLLNELAEDIRETQALRKDLVTKTRTYTAFILFTILFGTPLLLAISVHFVKLISGFSAIMGPTETAGFDLGMLGGGISLDPSFLIALSYVMLILTTLLASILMGIIQKGKATSGLRLAPLLIFVALLIFAASRYLIDSFFISIM
jgi:hypothetical protein